MLHLYALKISQITHCLLQVLSLLCSQKEVSPDHMPILEVKL